MVGSPSCTLADFQLPRIRKCCGDFDPKKIRWETAEVLGYGMDGWTWRLSFGPHVLKLVRLPSLDDSSGQTCSG